MQDQLNVMNALKSGAAADALLRTNAAKLRQNFEKAEKRAAEEESLLRTLPRRVISFGEHAMPERPWSGPEVLRIEEVERPVPKEDEVLVEVHASTVTRGEAMGVVVGACDGGFA